MPVLLLTAAVALLPALLLLRWFRNSDQFPEPWPVLRKVFYRGFLIIPPILVFTSSVENFRPESIILNQAIFDAFIMAAIPEELFKWLVLVFFCLRLKEFDEPMDGMVYGATVSLGFAMLENILYVIDGGLVVAIMRAITAVPAHALTGAIMGYFVGKTLAFQENKPRLLMTALVVPLLLHGLYDLPLMYLSSTDNTSETLVRDFMILLFFIVIAIEWRMVYVFKKRLQGMQ